MCEGSLQVSDLRIVYPCREHVERAWVDIERFDEQKDKDLREALINYAVMQISMCKKVNKSTSDIWRFSRNRGGRHDERVFTCSVSVQGIQVWNNAKECFLKM